ncbi:hypothetical protein [Pseudomonas sp. PDM20]|uniref:hypothetical protein n=1 Tax=Pseudomonas sp. PDM20 TaxID=2769254 RepID=UPI0017839AF6|nr:hypothetical protein [Pseudomonas sp. PDM20]MBD9682931.1 hypothetical protein [Pseudomonas sp. PDM20]
MSTILIHPGQFPVQHVTYTVRQYDRSPHTFVLYRVTTGERKVYEGVTDRNGLTEPIPTRYPDEMKIVFPNSVNEEER